jgi:hypothetical protein
MVQDVRSYQPAGSPFVRKRAQASFDPKKFLAKVGDGKAILNYLKNQIVFSQGEVADAK